MSKIERMKELVSMLSAASKSYYAEDREIMSNYWSQCFQQPQNRIMLKTGRS